MARPKIEIGEKETEQLARMAGLGLNMEQMAHVVGVSKDTLERRMKESEELNDAIESGRATATMQVMNTAYTLATSGQHPTMTMFWLKCRAHWKEKTEVEVNDVSPRKVVFKTRIAPDGQIFRLETHEDE